MKLPRKTKNTLTHSELVLLRTFAVGMGRLCVLDLMGIDDSEYNKIEASLFRKLEVKNAYFAVMTAFRRELLCAKQFCPETIKAVALAYAHQVTMRNDAKSELFKNRMWRFYDLLLGYEAYLITTHFSQ